MTDRTSPRPILLIGIFWGSIWGLWEATAGYLIHNTVRMPGTSGLLLVPFAVFCMYQALSASGSLRAVGVAAATAATLKMLDFLLPNLTVLSVVNPAMAIVLEGLAFSLVARGLGLPGRIPSLGRIAAGALAFNLSWRLLFLGFYGILAAVWSVGLFRDGPTLPAGFLFRDAVTSSLVITAMMALARQRRDGGQGILRRPGLIATVVVFVLAAAAELGTRML